MLLSILLVLPLPACLSKRFMCLFLPQDSLGGNARTMMIACLSPSDSNYGESESTLKYAHNTKFINNRPVVNVETDPKDVMIRDLQNEIKVLRNRLKA